MHHILSLLDLAITLSYKKQLYFVAFALFVGRIFVAGGKSNYPLVACRFYRLLTVSALKRVRCSGLCQWIRGSIDGLRFCACVTKNGDLYAAERKTRNLTAMRECYVECVWDVDVERCRDGVYLSQVDACHN